MSDSIVRATCPSCGDVVLTTGEIGLELDAGKPRFLFVCPGCHDQVCRDVPPGIVHILQAAGVHQAEPLLAEPLLAEPLLAQPLPDLISPEELDEFLADFDRVDCLDQLRRLIA